MVHFPPRANHLVVLLFDVRKISACLQIWNFLQYDMKAPGERQSALRTALSSIPSARAEWGMVHVQGGLQGTPRAMKWSPESPGR